MSNINFNSVRAGGPKPTGKTGPIDMAALEKLVESLPINDSVEVRGGGADAEMPALFKALSARDQQELMNLPASLRAKLLAGAPANVEAAKYQMSQELLRMTEGLVPGGIAFEPARAFRVSDAAIAYEVISNMSAADRARLAGTTFKRVQSTMIEQTHLNREVDGAAQIAVQDGTGMGGTIGGFFARLFEKWALTAPLGLMLRSWFPHALSETRAKVVEIGDAQATRMKEVLTHEIGHQLQVGDPDLTEMKEWAKLSGWTNVKTGEPATGLTASGELMGFEPDVRPTRKDNFVYEDFMDDTSPQAVKEAADAIKDPELKAEFLTTARIKKNLREAIKETFGVDAKGYSMTNPLEDFAESYRAFQIDPELLVHKAPDKFLFLNARSRKYTPDQVKTFFERSGKDPREVATGLATTGVTQDTVDRIFKANGLKADTQALAAAAAQELKGDDVPAFRKVFLELQQRIGTRDLTFVNSFTKDPAAALGGLWGQLSEAERAQFADTKQRVEVVQKMQAGLMSYASGASQGLKDVEQQAVQELGGKLLDSQFLAAAQADPAAALRGLERGGALPPSLKQLLSTAKGRESFKSFAGALSTMVSADNVWLLGGGDLQAKVKAGLSKWDAETLDLGLKMLAEQPEDAAKYFAGMKVTADGTVPPGGN